MDIDDLRRDLASSIPVELVDGLLDAYRAIKENYYLGRYEPAELNGGKFCEAIYRVLQHHTTKTYTPLGASIKPFDSNCRSFERQTGYPDTIRFHIPRLAIAIYDIRNKRGVGHLGGDVNPNIADSTIVATAADWIIADLIRLHYTCPLDEAQKWVDGLVQRKMLLVYEVGGRKRVLNPVLSYSIRVLVLLAAEFPNAVDATTLFGWTEHSNSSVFRKDVLQKLHRAKLIEFDGVRCTALPPGIKYVEANYQKWSVFKSPAVR